MESSGVAAPETPSSVHGPTGRDTVQHDDEVNLGIVVKNDDDDDDEVDCDDHGSPTSANRGGAGPGRSTMIMQNALKVLS